MGELYNPYPRLPKNIRQIGERDDVVKLYVEDYVNTYLKRLYPAGGQDLRVGLLLGSAESYEGTPYLFIDGALEMEDVTAAGEKVVFSEAAWRKAYQGIEETFPKRTVQGWFICGAPGCILSPLNYWKQHGQYFGGKNQLMYLNSGIDGEEALYVASEDGFYRLKGYSVYYERNQMMQDYMILRKDVHRVETGTGDRVIRDFRNRMEGRKQEAVSRSGTIRTLGTLCSVLSVAVLAGGVVMFNNYQKMKEMESVLVSVLPEGVRGTAETQDAQSGDKLVIEEVKGNVYPTGPQGNAGGILEQGRPVGKTPIPGAQEAESAGLTEPEAEEEGPLVRQGESGASDREGSRETGGADENSGGSALSEETKTQSPSQTAAAMEGAPAAAEGSEADNAAQAGEEDAVQTQPSGETEHTGGQETAEVPAANKKPGGSYIVGEGETLYGICFKLYKSLDYLEDICALNGLDDVNKIKAGQKLTLPDVQ
ncbi:MAG: LysM peptidoglycan-binding domain-containing protein [Clostridium sp.]|nr:LysM peptidoglycan-binding domain-containing protein [Clostridium sp.]